MSPQEIKEIFTYHSPQGDQQERLVKVRSDAKMLAHTIIECTPPSADQSASIRKLREAVMTANAAIVLGPDFLLERVVGAHHPFMSVVDVAQICHEANKALCEAQGDGSQLPWDQAPEWQQESAIKGVGFTLANPNAPASANHESWLAEKEADGWKYGEVKDPEKKEHPCFVPYEELPDEQKAKDYLFKSIVNGLAPFIA